jgi:hypothetical protein
MDMKVGNPDEVGARQSRDREKRNDKQSIFKVVPHYSLRHNENGIEDIIRDIRIHFLRYEAPYYTTEVNQDTGKCYSLEAKRKFTKYYLQHLAEFYNQTGFHYGDRKNPVDSI